MILEATLEGRFEARGCAAKRLGPTDEESPRELRLAAIKGCLDRPKGGLGTLGGQAVGSAEGELSPCGVADSVEDSTGGPPHLDRVRVLTDRPCQDP